MITYYKGTTSKIRIVVNDDNLVAQGITDFSLTGSTIVTEFESENGDFVKFTNDFVTIVDSETYDITPTATEVAALQLGYHTISGAVTKGGVTYGFKIAKEFYVDRLIQT